MLKSGEPVGTELTSFTSFTSEPEPVAGSLYEEEDALERKKALKDEEENTKKHYTPTFKPLRGNSREYETHVELGPNLTKSSSLMITMLTSSTRQWYKITVVDNVSEGEELKADPPAINIAVPWVWQDDQNRIKHLIASEKTLIKVTAGKEGVVISPEAAKQDTYTLRVPLSDTFRSHGNTITNRVFLTHRVYLWNEDEIRKFLEDGSVAPGHQATMTYDGVNIDIKQDTDTVSESDVVIPKMPLRQDLAGMEVLLGDDYGIRGQQKWRTDWAGRGLILFFLWEGRIILSLKFKSEQARNTVLKDLDMGTVERSFHMRAHVVYRTHTSFMELHDKLIGALKRYMRDPTYVALVNDPRFKIKKYMDKDPHKRLIHYNYIVKNFGIFIKDLGFFDDSEWSNSVQSDSKEQFLSALRTLSTQGGGKRSVSKRRRKKTRRKPKKTRRRKKTRRKPKKNKRRKRSKKRSKSRR